MTIKGQEKTAFQRRVRLKVVGLAALAADQLSTCDSAAVALRPSLSAHLTRPTSAHLSKSQFTTPKAQSAQCALHISKVPSE